MNETKKTALITGGGSGIGLEIAKLLAPLGYSLLLVGRDANRLNAAANGLRAAHDITVHVYSIDLSEPSAAQKLFEHTQQQGLDVNILINNAGFGIVDEHIDIDPMELYRMLQLNVVAVAELCQRYGRIMRKNRTGRILNIASTAGFQPTPYFAAYGASKAFVLNFSEALAKEMEDCGVSVSCLAPGPTDTDFFGTFDKRGSDDPRLFRKSGRDDPRVVARVGVELMLSGGLTRIVGAKNKFMNLGNRFAPRAVVATISKRLLRPDDRHP